MHLLRWQFRKLWCFGYPHANYTTTVDCDHVFYISNNTQAKKCVWHETDQDEEEEEDMMVVRCIEDNFTHTQTHTHMVHRVSPIVQ
jgi:hypothetical protein